MENSRREADIRINSPISACEAPFEFGNLLRKPLPPRIGVIRMRFFVVGLFVLLPAGPLWAKLEISKIEPILGVLGPERKSLDFYPLDELIFRFQIAGVKTDADGKTDVEIQLKLVNPAGKTVFEKKTTVLRQLALGDNTLPGYAYLPVPEKAPPGEYTFTVQITDRLAKETASFERKLTCKPVSFQIIDVRFWHDADSKVPAPAGGLLGETAHFKLRIIGFDKSSRESTNRLDGDDTRRYGQANCRETARHQVRDQQSRRGGQGDAGELQRIALPEPHGQLHPAFQRGRH